MNEMIEFEKQKIIFCNFNSAGGNNHKKVSEQ